MSFPTPAPTTEIEAVNVLLATIGEAPVNQIETPQTVDVSSAIACIQEVSRDIQTKGWYFNTELNYTLALDVSNNIPVPSNAVHIEIDKACLGSVDPVIRGSRLYDRKNVTYTFASTVKAKRMVILLPFTDLPQAARTYITIRASRLFADRAVGAESVHAYTQQQEFNAWQLLLADETRTEDYNVLRNQSIWPTVLR